MVWVRQFSNWFGFSVHYRRAPITEVTGQKSASSAQWLWLPFIWLYYGKALRAREQKRLVVWPILPTTSKHFRPTEPWGRTLRGSGWCSLFHLITCNISFPSCKQQGGLCITKAAGTDPRPCCDPNLPEIPGPCRESPDLSTLIASSGMRRTVTVQECCSAIRRKAYLPVPVVCYLKYSSHEQKMRVRGENYLGFLKLYTSEPGVLGWRSEVLTACISVTKIIILKITSSLGKMLSTGKADFLCLVVLCERDLPNEGPVQEGIRCQPICVLRFQNENIGSFLVKLLPDSRVGCFGWSIQEQDVVVAR